MNQNVKIKVLGSGQDGGVPHPLCHCPFCRRARADVEYRRLAPSIAVYSEEAGFCYVIDASPDFAPQMELLEETLGPVTRPGKAPLSGILLTHAHIGQYPGLLVLGKEVLDEKSMPVYCTSSMASLLSTSPPFSLLIQNGNIGIREIEPGRELAIDGVRFKPLAVPHRGEITDTVGFVIEAGRKAVYVPDTDEWTAGVLAEISRSDIALIDGTFYSRDEIGRFGDVPHPPIVEALGIFEGLNTEIYFTHINHTNPVNVEGPERARVESSGFKLAYDGLTLSI